MKKDIDEETLQKAIEAYKSYFPEHWEDEKYKWEAIQHFQMHWDIDATDFASMLIESLAKTSNLLNSSYYFPKGMICELATAEPDSVRAMFIHLFDETRKITERIPEFSSSAEKLNLKVNSDGMKKDYQDYRAISVYLWLRYPDTYYIYKPTIYSSLIKKLELSDSLDKIKNKEKIFQAFEIYDKLKSTFQKDDSIKSLLLGHLTNSCYADPELNTMIIDFGFFLDKFYKEDKDYKTDSHNYWWLNANPKLWDLSQWKVGETQEYTLYNDDGHKRRIFKNFLDAKLDDIVFCYETNPVKKLVSVAKISKPSDGKEIQIKNIEKLENPIEHEELTNINELKNMEALKTPTGSFFKVSQSEYDTLIHFIHKDDGKDRLIEKYSDTDFLSEVYLSKNDLQTLKVLLTHKLNVILEGAPGVGKTFTAKRLAYASMGEKDDSRIAVIQFHQNYSYEDFVMGYKPNGAEFELRDGIFKKFCEKAQKDPTHNYYFIIDEINRGNLSKIFGELLMLIEKDYRGSKHQIELAYNHIKDEKFYVPENLFIIGMMNTADRSLAMIDYALRRRFCFFTMIPGFDSKGFKDYQKGLNSETFNKLIDLVNELNKRISEDDSLGEGFQIGHSYFCDQKECTQEWMKEVVDYEIKPMLKEYWYDNKEEITIWNNKFDGLFTAKIME